MHVFCLSLQTFAFQTLEHHSYIVSSHSKVSHSTLINSMHWSPSFTNMVKKFHPFYGTPFLCHKSLPLGPYPEPDESTHITQFV